MPLMESTLENLSYNHNNIAVQLLKSQTREVLNENGFPLKRKAINN